jgi:anti-sigma-K factor RskA
MSATLSHDQAEQLLPAAALEILEGDELLEVAAHVQQCARCAALLESYREVVAGLATRLPEQEFPSHRSARVRDRLLARVAGGAAGVGLISPRHRSTGWVGRWAGWAVAAGMAGVLVVHHAVHRPVAYGWLIAGVLVLLLVALAVYTRAQKERIMALEQRLRSVVDRGASDSNEEGNRRGGPRENWEG